MWGVVVVVDDDGVCGGSLEKMRNAEADIGLEMCVTNFRIRDDSSASAWLVGGIAKAEG